MKRIFRNYLVFISFLTTGCTWQDPALTGAGADSTEWGDAGAAKDTDAGDPVVDAGSPDVVDADAAPACDAGADTGVSPDAGVDGAGGGNDSDNLPTGPCDSQDDCGGEQLADLVFCKPAACGRSAGVCTPRPSFCPHIVQPVCGCNGTTYENACFESYNEIGFAYDGPCRSGEVVRCSASEDCGSGQICAQDPGAACAPGEDCPGVCLDTSNAACGAEESDDASVTFRCASKSETCEAVLGCTGPGCTSCVYTSQRACGSELPCPDGQLCVTSSVADDAGAYESWCAVP